MGQLLQGLKEFSAAQRAGAQPTTMSQNVPENTSEQEVQTRPTSLLEGLKNFNPNAPVQQGAAAPATMGEQADGEVGGLETFFSGVGEGISTDTTISDVSTLLKATDLGSKLMDVPKQYGVEEDVWKGMSQSERRILISEIEKDKARKGLDPDIDTEGFGYKAGRFVGSLVDPTTLLPLGGMAKLNKARQLAQVGEKAAANVMAAKGLTAMVTTGAAMGMTDAALYSAAKLGEVKPEIVAMGGAAGAVLPTAAYGIGRGIGKVRSVAQEKKASGAILKALNETKASFRAEGMSDIVSTAKAVEVLGLDEKALGTVLKRTGKQVETFKSKKAALDYTYASQAPTGKVPKSKIGQAFSNALTPMDSKLKEIAPRVYGKIMEGEVEAKKLLHQYDIKVDGHIKDIKKLKKKGVLTKYWNMALSEGNEAEMKAYLRTHLGDDAVKNYEAYAEVIEDILKKENSVRGSKNQIKGIAGYYPRYAKDPEALYQAIKKKYRKEVVSQLDRKLKKIGQGKKVVTEHDRGKAIADFVTDLYQRPAKVVPGYSKKRIMQDVDEDLLQYYSPLEQSIHTRIRRGVDEYTMRKVLGKNIAEKYGDSVENGIVDWLGNMAKKGQIDETNVDYVKELLKTRYLNAAKGTSRGWQIYKAIQHGTLLPQAGSVITQLEDLARTAYRFGVGDTASAFFRKSNKFIDPKKQGFIDNLQEEYIHQGASKRIVNDLFKYSGFQATDLAGKGTHQNAALRNYGKKAISPKGAAEINEKWYGILGDKRTRKVIEDFRAFHKAKLKREKAVVTPDMENIAFMELADMQPITQWGMPKAYWDHPNLRFMYVLRSFTIKQLDNYRTQVFNELRKGNIKPAFMNAVKLISYMTAAGMTKDQIVNWMHNKDEAVEASLWKNVLRATGVFDKHTLAQMSRGKPIESFLGGVMPPTGVIGDAAETTMKAGKDIFTEEDIEYDEDYRKYVPFIGRIWSNWVKAEKESENW